MQTFKNTRLNSHQLLNTECKTAGELLLWMGALQAQDFNMAKWAIGSRTKNISNKLIEDAFNDGKILRTHVMRPTWHFVAPEDIRWMLKLSAQRIKASSYSRDKDLGITEELYTQVNFLLEKILRDNKHLMREEVGNELEKNGVEINSSRMIHFMMRAEVEAIVCSGALKNNKQTYALLEERVAPAPELSNEESLALLAQKYFQSHSPASLPDFVWWSGLSVSNAKSAIQSIKNSLITISINEQSYFIHQSMGNQVEKIDDTLFFLPAFDEYLISYKDRSTVLKSEYYGQAFTKNGIFSPILIYNGQVVGSWKKTQKKGLPGIEANLFEHLEIDHKLLNDATDEYKKFFF